MTPAFARFARTCARIGSIPGYCLQIRVVIWLTVTLPPGQPRTRDPLLRMSVCAAGQPAHAQVSRDIGLSVSDREFPGDDRPIGHAAGMCPRSLHRAPGSEQVDPPVVEAKCPPSEFEPPSAKFVKLFFSQSLLEGPFVTAGKAWICPNFRSVRAFSKTSRTAWLAIPRPWNSGRIIHPIS